MAISPRLIHIATIVSAILAAVVVWLKVPVVGNPWLGVIWFTTFAALAELLALSLGDENNVCFTPTSPIYWAAICVLGPLPALVVCACSAILADLVACLSYMACGWMTAKTPDGNTPGWLKAAALRTLSRASTIWEMRAGKRWVSVIRMSSQYVSALVLAAAPAGLAYYYLGGHFLVDIGPEFHLMGNFVYPFIGLVLVSLAAEHGLHMLVVAAIDPIPGTRGFYGAVLRMRLAFIENALPVVRPQLFLITVALLLAYLYANIGILGFVVAAMPVMALRDFFYQWLEKRNAYLNTITTLATYMQLYHPYTRGHLKRVADISERLATELRLSAVSIRHMRPAALMHDIGKIGVSEEILDKPGKLTDEEWEKIKEHPVKGADIISHMEFLENIVDWIKYHHKWHNGAGYPATNGNGANIPIEAAIIAVADSFDAMTDDRELTVNWKCDSCGFEPEDGARPDQCPSCGAPKRRLYREPKTLDQAIDELRRGAGTQFHPKVVKAFLTMVERDGIHLNV